MSEKKQDRASLRTALEEARQKGDNVTADRLEAVLKALDELDATIVAMLATTVATL